MSNKRPVNVAEQNPSKAFPNSARNSKYQQMEAELQRAERLLNQAFKEAVDPAEIQPRGDLPQLADPEVSVVVPVFNQHDAVFSILEDLLHLPLNLEVVVVDDASTDGTVDRLMCLDTHPRIHVISLPVHLGKGAAVRTGYRQAAGEIVVIQDVDLDYDTSSIPALIQPIREGLAEVVYGSRFLEEDASASVWARWSQGVLNRLSNWTTGLTLTDVETCQKAFCRDILLGVPMEQARVGFETEITARLAQLQARFLEVPISCKSSEDQERERPRLRDLIAKLYCVFRYGWMS